MIRSDDFRFQSFVERYVATLFAQCRQIATVFENFDLETDEVAALKARTQLKQPEATFIDEASPIVREVGNVADVGNVAVPATLGPQIVPCDSYDVHLDVPDAPGASKPSKPFSPVAPPGSPSRRSSISRPGPWSTCESEASRLRRILDGVVAPSSPCRRRFRRSATRDHGGGEKSRPSKDVRRNSIRRASVTSASSLTSVMSFRNFHDHRSHFSSPHGVEQRSRSKEESSDSEGKRSRSIFALPGEEEEASKVQGASKRSYLPKYRNYGRGQGKEGRYSGASKRSSKAKRSQVQEVNRNLEAKLLERFRLAKEDDLETAAVPETTTTVLLLHQLASLVALSFDDTRVAKAAFDKQDVRGRGILEFEDFVQAVLDIHQNINMSCTMATLVQCEHLCNATFPAEEGSSTIDLVQFLQWYSTYSFHESLLLAPDMRDLRRLSRQYGIPWEEVHNVKRHFDAVDTDQSGEIDFEEFTLVLRKVLQVAPELDLPPNRARYFWKQLDTDGSGKADFSEFLPWWLKYFQQKEGKNMLVKPFEDFYKSVRCLKNPDPPPFMNKMAKRMVLQKFEDPTKGAQRTTAERRISSILTERRLSRAFS